MSNSTNHFLLKLQTRRIQCKKESIKIMFVAKFKGKILKKGSITKNIILN